MGLMKYGVYVLYSRFKDRPGHMLTAYLSMALWQVPLFLLNLGIVFSVDVPEPEVFLVVGVLANAIVMEVMAFYRARMGSLKTDLRFLLSLGAPLSSIYPYVLLRIFSEATVDVLVYTFLATLFGIYLSPWFYLALFTLIFPIYTIFTLLSLPTMFLPERHALSSIIRPTVYLLLGSIYPVSVLPGPARDIVNLLGLADMLNLLRASASGVPSPLYFLLLIPYIPLSFFAFWLSVELLRKTGKL